MAPKVNRRKTGKAWATPQEGGQKRKCTKCSKRHNPPTGKRCSSEAPNTSLKIPADELLTELSGRLCSSSPVTVPVPDRASLTSVKSLDLLADTMVKLKAELREVRGEMAALREDKVETSWANFLIMSMVRTMLLILPKLPLLVQQ